MIGCEECKERPASGLYAGTRKRGGITLMFLCGGCGFNISSKRGFSIFEDERGREVIARPLKFPRGVKLVVSGVSRHAG